MSIVKRGNSKFWYIHFQFNGEIYIRSTRTTNKKAAERMEVEWKAELHSHQYQGRKQRIKLADAFEQYKLSKKGIASYGNQAGTRFQCGEPVLHSSEGGLASHHPGYPASVPTPDLSGIMEQPPLISEEPHGGAELFSGGLTL